MACCGMLWHVVACCGMLWYVVVCCGMLWYVVVCCGMLWTLRTHVDTQARAARGHGAVFGST